MKHHKNDADTLPLFLKKIQPRAMVQGNKGIT